MKAKLLTGSICITDLMNAAKAAHSSCTRGKNGKAYANILVWESETPDQYGNTISIQLNSTKEKRETEEKVYIGNAKPLAAIVPQQPTENKNEDDLDLPF